METPFNFLPSSVLQLLRLQTPLTISWATLSSLSWANEMEAKRPVPNITVQIPCPKYHCAKWQLLCTSLCTCLYTLPVQLSCQCLFSVFVLISSLVMLSLHLSRSQLLLNPMQALCWKQVMKRERLVANLWHMALFSGSAWAFGLKVHSTWYHLEGECKSFERSKRSQAGSLHKSIRKLNTVKSACCLPAVPTMKAEIILVKHDLWSTRWRN